MCINKCSPENLIKLINDMSDTKFRQQFSKYD